MSKHLPPWRILFLALSLAQWTPAARAETPNSPATPARIGAALSNVQNLMRPGQTGLATFWDGNKFVQCRMMEDRSWRCEAAGALMQPSLGRILTPERVGSLQALGWVLDTSFGSYVRSFDAESPVADIAAAVAKALELGYGANISKLEISTNWVRSEKCPPRNGPGQNLAGSINDAPSMKAVSIHACAYTPDPAQRQQPIAASASELVTRYGKRVTGEIERLHVNLKSKIFFGIDAGGGYVQCQAGDAPPALYCEAASAESVSILVSVLTPERLKKLHALGYQDPGYAPNYSKTYPFDKFDDAAIARELLAMLFDVYGYDGRQQLKFFSEKGNL